MKKTILSFLFVALAATGAEAQKYLTRTAKVHFDATTSHSPEKIEGVNNEVGNILDAKTGDLVFQVLIKSFKFEKQLMEEHFHENYMESDKYPKADFKGVISNLSEVNFSKDGTYNVTVTGILTIHGVANKVSVPGTITVKGNTLVAKAKFNVVLKEYKIDVPSLVADKLAKTAIVTLESNLVQK